MVLHRNAKLGLAGRFALVRAVEEGLSLKAAAAAFATAAERLMIVSLRRSSEPEVNGR